MYRFRRSGKYNAHAFYVEGIRFDSKREGLRYRDLRLLESAGEISGLRRQETFELIPVQKEPDQIGPRGGVKPGKVLERAVEYIADFVYFDKSGNLVVEDAKGVRTPEYVIKRKLMLYRYHIRIKEV